MNGTGIDNSSRFRARKGVHWPYALLCLLLAWALLVIPHPVQAQMLTGSYTGDGTDDRVITQLGFRADLVIIKGDFNTAEGVARTSTMTGDQTKPLNNNSVLNTNRIQSLDSTGFTIGSDTDVNRNTTTYYWMAFKAKAGELAVGSYTGNGTSQSVAVGFQPDYVIMLGNTADKAVHSSSAMPGDTTSPFGPQASFTGDITSLTGTGFNVGSHATVNASGTDYHYIAFKNVAGTIRVSSYTGNGIDNTNITGVGFQPEYLIISQDASLSGAHRSATVTGDSTLEFGGTNSADRIQALQADGFQVGTDNRVNANGTTYYYVAFVRQAPARCGHACLAGDHIS